MNILSQWIRSYVPGLTLSDRELAEALTLRGIAVEGIFELGPGQGSVFEMDITTNRVDAMNHYGIAREAAAIVGHALAPLDVTLPPSQPAAKPVTVSIEAPELCGRFTARALSQVRIQPSAGVVAERFPLLQQKLISNAVDETNYVTTYRRLLQGALDGKDQRIAYQSMAKWVADNPPFPARAYREWITWMYKENALVAGHMRLRGERVDLARIEQNLLVVTAGADHIAPREGTLPLLDLVCSDDVTHLDRPGGHIGLMAGSKAKHEIWPEPADWMSERSGH